MKYHIARLIIAHQPLPLPPSLSTKELLAVVGEDPELVHVDVIRVDALGLGELCCAPAEVVFDGAPEGDGVGEVDQPAAVGGNVACVLGSAVCRYCASVNRMGGLTNGHPSREKKCASVSQEQLVVVDPCAHPAGWVMAQHCAPEKDLLFPVHNVPHHLA